MTACEVRERELLKLLERAQVAILERFTEDEQWDRATGQLTHPVVDEIDSVLALAGTGD